MVNEIIIAASVLGGVGILSGFFLSYLSKKFKVEIDPKIKEVRDLLPGLNCGSCGFAGCDSFAEALVCENEDVTKCKPGINNHGKICKLLGQELKECEKKVAKVLCAGGKDKTSKKFEYVGEPRCKSAAQVLGGPKSCSYGCLGYGDCVKVCPENAITINKDGIAEIDPEKCVACGKCIEECPKGIISLVPSKNKYYVKCNSKDINKDVVKNCKVGCISCKLCETVCKFDAIHVINNIAVIDYEKCKNCGLCFQKCPRKIITKVE